MKTKIKKYLIILKETLKYILIPLFIVSLLILTFYSNGWGIREETIKEIYYYKKQATIINKNMANKVFQNIYEIENNIKNLVDNKFYNENIYYLKSNVEILPPTFNKETYNWEENGVIYKKLYIPSEEDIEKIKKYKNKLYDNINDFYFLLRSLNLKTELIKIINKNLTFIPQIKIFAISAFITSLIGFVLLIFLYILLFKDELQEQIKTKKEIKEEEKNNPEKIKPVLDYAKIELQEQITIIKNQAKIVFIFSIIFLCFGIVAILLTILKKDIPNKIALITAIGGAITEIIGGVFLVMYKSLISQLNENLKILERLNIIGISIKILDTIAINNKEKINNVKIELTKKIIDKIHY